MPRGIFERPKYRKSRLDKVVTICVLESKLISSNALEGVLIVAENSNDRHAHLTQYTSRNPENHKHAVASIRIRKPYCPTHLTLFKEGYKLLKIRDNKLRNGKLYVFYLERETE